MEHLMESCVQTMVNSLNEFCDKNHQPTMNISFNAREQMDNFTMNVIGKCAFATNTIGNNNSNSNNNNDNQFLKMAKKLLNFNLTRFMLTSVTPYIITKKLANWKFQPYYLPEMNFFENLTRHLVRERKTIINNNNNEKKFNDMLQLMIQAEHNLEKLQLALKEENQDQGNQDQVSDAIKNQNLELNNIIGSKYLSEEEIMAQVVVFLLAGYETTASTLSFCLYELATNPVVQQRLYEEIQISAKTANDPTLGYTKVLEKLEYLDAVLSETLRKYPPAWILSREIDKNNNKPYRLIDGLLLEPGQTVMVPVYAIHHSEAYFPEPDQFLPDRFLPENRHKILPYTYLPFGVGPRNCIGMRFALTEAKMALAAIVNQYEIIATDRTSDRLNIMKGSFLLRTSPIYVGIRKRK